jgi:putative addiction module component (TIGR02574 family)
MNRPEEPRKGGRRLSRISAAARTRGFEPEQDLWDDLVSTPEVVPVYDWQKIELARRKANLQSNADAGLDWEEIKRRIRTRYGR